MFKVGHPSFYALANSHPYIPYKQVSMMQNIKIRRKIFFIQKCFKANFSIMDTVLLSTPLFLFPNLFSFEFCILWQLFSHSGETLFFGQELFFGQKLFFDKNIVCDKKKFDESDKFYSILFMNIKHHHHSQRDPIQCLPLQRRTIKVYGVSV